MNATNVKLFSVVLLHFKQELLWPTAIDSILAQDYKHIEIVFADDGTPRFDPEKVKRYVDKSSRQDVTVRFMLHDENRGTLVTFNDADKLCTGDYILHFASDDALAHPQALSHLAVRIDSEPDDVCGVFGQLVNCDEHLVKDPHTAPIFPEEYLRSFDSMSAEEQFVVSATRGCGILPMGACAFRASSYRNTIPIVEGTYLLEDWPYEVGATYAGYRFRYLGEDILLYRAGGASRGIGTQMSTSQKQAYVDHVHCYETAIFPKDLEDRLTTEQLAKTLRNYANARFEGNLWFAYDEPEAFYVEHLDLPLFERILNMAKRVACKDDDYTFEEAIDMGFLMISALDEGNQASALALMRNIFGQSALDLQIIRFIKENGRMRKNAITLNEVYQETAHGLETTVGDLENAYRDLWDTQQELSQIESSTTWKAGRIVMILPTTIKDLVAKKRRTRQ